MYKKRVKPENDLRPRFFQSYVAQRLRFTNSLALYPGENRENPRPAQPNPRPSPIPTTTQLPQPPPPTTSQRAAARDISFGLALRPATRNPVPWQAILGRLGAPANSVNTPTQPNAMQNARPHQPPAIYPPLHRNAELSKWRAIGVAVPNRLSPPHHSDNLFQKRLGEGRADARRLERRPPPPRSLRQKKSLSAFFVPSAFPRTAGAARPQ